MNLRRTLIGGGVLAALTLILMVSGSGDRAYAQDETLTPAATTTPDTLVCPPIPENVSSPFTYYVGFGNAEFARARYRAAIDSYTCALQIQPDYAPAFASRGYAYTALGDSEQALADYDQSLLLDELYLPAYINRGALYTRLGNFGLAINDLTLAISLDPNNLIAFNNRAVVHAIEGNIDLALADLDAAIAIDVENPLAYATRAAVYSALAARDYRQFVETSQTDILPAGTPVDVLVAIDDSLETGDFSVWLSLLSPAS